MPTGSHGREVSPQVNSNLSRMPPGRPRVAFERQCWLGREQRSRCGGAPRIGEEIGKDHRVAVNRKGDTLSREVAVLLRGGFGSPSADLFDRADPDPAGPAESSPVPGEFKKTGMCNIPSTVDVLHIAVDTDIRRPCRRAFSDWRALIHYPRSVIR